MANKTTVHNPPITNVRLYQASVITHGATIYALAGAKDEKRLLVSGDSHGFTGDMVGDLKLCPLTPANAARLRERLPWLRPQPLGLAASFGFGDRLGLATPGHVRAVRQFDLEPVFAQQSVRENARTGRTPQQVLDEAMWGLFQEGWRQPWGADADHLKTSADIDTFVAAGYSLFTIDPGDHVDNEAHTAPPEVLQSKLAVLPWDALEDTLLDLEGRFLGQEIRLGELSLAFDRVSLWRAAAKYGRAIAHTASLYRHLLSAMGGSAFELEVSVDETDTPTAGLEHLYVATQLRRLGVSWISLAPRYVGRFEKGVDYIGDLATFDREIAHHAAIARAVGPYKLSLHSGSDKFSVYPMLAHHAGSLVHVKTAGTSYLEALRTIARVEPDLFRSILEFARSRYDVDRATYHVSADLARVPLPGEKPADALPGLLDQFDTRQVLHVSFGSVLQKYGPQIKDCLVAHESEHYAALEAHFVKHLTPFG